MLVQRPVRSSPSFSSCGPYEGEGLLRVRGQLRVGVGLVHDRVLVEEFAANPARSSEDYRLLCPRNISMPTIARADPMICNKPTQRSTGTVEYRNPVHGLQMPAFSSEAMSDSIHAATAKAETAAITVTRIDFRFLVVPDGATRWPVSALLRLVGRIVPGWLDTIFRKSGRTSGLTAAGAARPEASRARPGTVL